MADFGASNNATTINTLTGSSATHYFVGGSSFPGGDITGMFSYCANRNSGGSFNDVDWAIYSGGTASDPTGATLVAQSKHYGASVDIGSNSAAWNELYSSGTTPITATGVAAGYLWFVMRAQDGVAQELCDDADAGDLNQHTIDTASAGSAGTPGSSWPSTFPSAGSATGSGTMKIRITYVNYSLEQTAHRFGEDDGSESAHTFAAAENANLTRALGSAFLYRAQVEATGDPGPLPFTLYAQKNGAGSIFPVQVGTTTSPTLAFGAAGTIAYSASGGTIVAPTYPTGITTNSCLVMVVGQKPSSANGGTVTTPTGWTLRAQNTGATDGDTGGYTTTLGADTGNTNIFVYTKDTVTGSETGTETVTVGTNNVCWANIYRFEASAPATFAYDAGVGKDTSAGSVSIATGNIAIAAGDMVLGAMVIPTDVTTPAQFSAEAFAQTGTTFGTAAEIEEPDSTTGNDIGGFVCYNTVSSGSGSGAVTLSATAGGTTTNVRGPGAVLRIRATGVTNEIYIALSANIASGGEDTTNRLTAGGGSFVTGRRWDNENGSDDTDLTTNNFSEFEWSLNTQAPAAATDYFDLYTRAGSTALDTYTNVGRITIASSDPAPSVGSIALTGFAPTLIQGTNLSPVVGALALSGVAPSVVQGSRIETGVGALSMAGIAPLVTQQTIITPNAGALSIEGVSAVIERENFRFPSTAALSFGSIAPIVSQQFFITPSTGALALTGVEPSLELPNTRTPQAASLSFVGNFASVTQQIRISPSTGALTAGAAAPTLSGSVSISPQTGALAFTGVAPALDLGTPAPNVGVLALTGIAPVVSIQFRISPSAGALSLAGNAPNVASNGSVTITPDTGAIGISGGSVALDLFMPTATGALALAGVAPTLIHGTVIQPSTGSMAMSGNLASVSRQFSITPSTGELSVTGFAADLGGQTNIVPTVGAALITGIAPVVSRGTVIVPSTGALAFGGIAPQLYFAFTISPETGAISIAGEQVGRSLNQLITPITGALLVNGLTPNLGVPSPNIVPGTGSLVFTSRAPFDDDDGIYSGVSGDGVSGDGVSGDEVSGPEVGA